VIFYLDLHADYYLHPEQETQLVVDTSRGETLNIHVSLRALLAERMGGCIELARCIANRYVRVGANDVNLKGSHLQRCWAKVLDLSI
jgi:hypothetical protein